MRRTAQYVKVSDGTPICIDLLLPGDLKPGEQVPTLITQTPYFRAVEFRHPLAKKIATKLAFLGTEDFAMQCVGHGYAFVLMDLRGSGASHGQKSNDAMRDAAADGSDVIDWIVGQPWSNGRVGSTGVSGHGLCALWQTTARNPALRAIAPRFTAFDNYASTHPGGTTAIRFMRDIGALVAAMDRNELWKMPDNPVGKLVMRAMIRGIKPADDDADHSQLAAAVQDHRRNASPAEEMASAEYRDDVMVGSTRTIDEISVFAVGDEIRAAGVPVHTYAGWMDAAFARELINFHTNVASAIPGSRLTVGPWGHGGKWYSSPLADGKVATAFDHAADLVRSIDASMRDGAALDEAPIHYFTMGAERWNATTSWPVPATMTSFYLDGVGRLSAAVGQEGSDPYAVDFTHGTGVHSRFGKHLTTEMYPVRYPDRAMKDHSLLVYDSAPLAIDTEVTGHPIARLWLHANVDDVLVIVYVEDVAPDGTVRTVADGWLRASDRKVSHDPPYTQPGPYHTFRRVDREPLVPGEVVEVAFDLYPTSWLFRAGHSVRVAIAGADKDNLTDYGRDGDAVITLHRGPARPSRVDLPVVLP